MKLNKQVFMGSLRQIAVWRVAWEPGTAAVLIKAAGASLAWLLPPLFLTSQVSLIMPQTAMSYQGDMQLLPVLEKVSLLLSASGVPRGAQAEGILLGALGLTPKLPGSGTSASQHQCCLGP